MKILLVDDHILFRQGLCSLLDTQPDMTVVGQAASAAEAILKTRELQPDTILMDISMPGVDGLEAARQILAEYCDIKIVFLTAHEDEDRLFEAIKLGGKGYLLKNMRTVELLDMLRGLDRNEAALSRRMAAKLLIEFAQMGRQLNQLSTFDEEEIVLTDRETDILTLVAQGVSNRQIAAQLDIAESTVKNHMRNILSKLHLKNRREAVAFARRHGLLNATSSEEGHPRP